MNNIQTIQNLIPTAKILNVYCYGSQVYGTATQNSDYDFIVVGQNVKDHNQVDSFSGDISLHTYTPRMFQQHLDEHKISAMECFFLPESLVVRSLVPFTFKLDRSLLRKEISAKASNSWVKCKKKLTVENDFYIGVKSLFHSFRIVDFGLQIAKDGVIYDYSSANTLWEEIRYNYDNEQYDWNFYNNTFKSRHNQLMTEFRKYAEK